MRKCMEKLNANAVGVAAHSDPLNQNGITLIALIITIIVMLILVGVTINVALNGGLFTKASEAAEVMQIAAEKEELLSAVMGAIGNDGKIQFGDIVLPTGWTGSNGTYTSPKGNVYTVDANGKITEGEAVSEEVDDDLAYMKAELLGKKQSEIMDIDASVAAGGPVLKNPKITYVYKEKYETSPAGVLSYNSKDFVVVFNGEENPEDVEIIYVYYDVEDSNNYFEVATVELLSLLSEEDINYPKDSIILLGLTQKGEEILADTKKLVIPKAILGTDGKNYDISYMNRYCFEDNTDIEQLEFESGSNLVEIDYNVFDGCINLSGTVIIPNSVTKIGPSAFDGCNLIEEIKIPSSVIEIGHEAFRGCTSIESITIPSSVDNLGRGAFDGWTSEQTINMQRIEEPATTDEYRGDSGWYSGWRDGCNANVLWGQ